MFEIIPKDLLLKFNEKELGYILSGENEIKSKFLNINPLVDELKKYVNLSGYTH